MTYSARKNGPRPIRVFKNAPRARLAIAGDPRYLGYFSSAATWDGTPYVAFLADAPAKILPAADVIDPGGALVIRRSLAETALAPWIERGFVRLLPVAIAAIKLPNGPPKFDKPATDTDFAIVDPLVEAAADRRALAEYSFNWGENAEKEVKGSRERALLTSWNVSPFDADRAPPEPIFRANELTLDIWVGAEVEASAAPRTSKAPAIAASEERATSATFQVVVAKGFADASVSLDSDDEPAWGFDVRDGDVVATIVDTKAGATLAKAIAKVEVLASRNTGPWVLRKALATQLFAGVSGAVLRKAKVKHKGKALAGDFVYVNVTEERPLDRDVAKAEYADAKRPWSSVVRAVTEVRVVAAPGDELVLARVTEFPGLIVASEKLAQRWKKAKAPLVAAKPPHAHLRPLPCFPTWDEGPAFPKAEVPSSAFRGALAGDAAARAKAVKHPIFAYGVARLVDRKPADDTRSGALGHPHTAALYARFVDREPRPDTRAAVASCGPAALFYARFVDRRLTKDLRAALLARGFAKEDLKELEAQLRS
jgi:hypothetical protein